jgi:AmiR/NasT family two-component response regulator
MARRWSLAWGVGDPLKIVIVDESPIRAAILEEGLREAGFMTVERLSSRRHRSLWKREAT